MPFVQRVVSPVYLARARRTAKSPEPIVSNGNGPNHSGVHSNGQLKVRSRSGDTSVAFGDIEFDAVTNLTLSNALRQLASLMLLANDIFEELNKELGQITCRSKGIKSRIDKLGERVDEFDPKLVTVRK